MRTGAMIKRIIRQIVRDKRTLALLFLAPLLILSLMYFMFNGNTEQPRLGAAGVPDPIVQALGARDIQVVVYDQASRDTLTEDGLDGLLMIADGKLQLTLLNSDPTGAKALQMKISQAIGELAASLTGQGGPGLAIDYVYGSAETNFFDVLSPVLIGFFVFFFVFLISGIGLLRERTTGTLERLVSTPVRRWEIIAGYLAGYGILAVIQTVIVVIYSITVLDIVLVGSIWNVILINLLLALVALSLGILLSTFAASEFQMVQFIPIVVIPQIFFAGIIPMGGMAEWLQALGKVMPLYYAADALKGVMYQGLGFGDIAFDALVLAAFAVLFIVLNIQALKKYRKL